MASAVENLAMTEDFTLRLCEALRRRGVDVGFQQSITCMRAIALQDLVREDDLKRIYRLTLINRKQDLWALHAAFEQVLKDFAKAHAPEDDDAGETPPSQSRTQRVSLPADMAAQLSAESTLAAGYSTREVDHHKDFKLFPTLEIPVILAELRKIARRHATEARRTFKRSNTRRGRLDLRGSIRQTVKYDGEIMRWRFKRRRPRRTRFVVIADVSGSMEIYCLFLLNFLHQLNLSRQMKVESFVFSTRLERLTREFRTRNFHEVLRKVALSFSGWSGGTKIGAAISALNSTHETLVTPKTHVIIMSDGWDTGDSALLDQEMDKLRRRAKSIIWINPLQGDVGYEPLAQGMATAAPYCDLMMAGHSLNSFDTLAGVLRES